MKIKSSVWCVLIAKALALAATMAFAETNPGASTIRPPGCKPMKSDPDGGKTLFNDRKPSTNGMLCASCCANHSTFLTSFAKPYPHTVAMALDQLGRKRVHLDEMV